MIYIYYLFPFLAILIICRLLEVKMEEKINIMSEKITNSKAVKYIALLSISICVAAFCLSGCATYPYNPELYMRQGIGHPDNYMYSGKVYLR